VGGETDRARALPIYARDLGAIGILLAKRLYRATNLVVRMGVTGS